MANTPEDRQNFVMLVVKRAEGVFLWVMLVLHRLGEDLEVTDSLEELHQTLDQVPKELEDRASNKSASQLIS
ncbi:hypothetical protein BKA65DRAFT_157842 [Rhexocercosporidium sp. MPI-PUGE-AT-0058]|nr:hypothetical protein BKA65DRAFT_157842 [Rhexocercosporidium sp. MPI-PUGE-AT-0058]